MGFAEQLARMKSLLAKAEGMDMLGNPGLYSATLLQIIGELEVMARKKRHEVENIKQQIAFCDGQAQACDMMIQIVGNLLENFIKKENDAREEASRQKEERTEAARSARGRKSKSEG